MAKQLEDFDANLAGEEGKTEETKSSWFKRIKKGINTKTSEKKETPEGLMDQMPRLQLYLHHFGIAGTFVCLPQMQLPSPYQQQRIL